MENKNTFEAFGYTFEILEGNHEVALLKSDSPQSDIIIPREVPYNGEIYTVTKFGGRLEKKMSWIGGKRNPDGRKKQIWLEEPELIDTGETIEIGPFCDLYLSKGSAEPSINNHGTYRITSVILPDTIKCLGKNCFYECREMKTFTIPPLVKVIPEGAFRYCTKLEEIIFPKNLVSIEACAFRACNLKSTNLPYGLKTIGKRAFYSSFQPNSTIEIPTSVVSLDSESIYVPYSCDGPWNIKIYNHKENILIASNAINSNATSIEFLEPKIEKSQQKEDSIIAQPEKKSTSTPNASGINLDKLIAAAVIDGVVTDKEKAVILKKATAAGMDADEVEMLIDAKLFEVTQKEKAAKVQSSSSSVTQENEVDVKPQASAVETPKAKDAPKCTAKKESSKEEIIIPDTISSLLKITIKGQETVKELKNEFKEQLGSTIRIYDGRSAVSDDKLLSEINPSIEEKGFNFNTEITTEEFIQSFQKQVGLKVKVYTCDGWVAVLGGVQLSKSGLIKKNATKADMEAFLDASTVSSTGASETTYKKSVTYQEYIIREKTDGGIEVLHSNDSTPFDNTKNTLREIAEKKGFDFDSKWTTRQLGSKLIDFLLK